MVEKQERIDKVEEHIKKRFFLQKKNGQGLMELFLRQQT
jgi:hypothetical protein